jgi:hypothetical protein
LELTRSNLYSFRIVIGNIVFDPFPVYVTFSFGFGVSVKAFGNFAIAYQAWCKCNLESKPILGLSDVKSVSILDQRTNFDIESLV